MLVQPQSSLQLRKWTQPTPPLPHLSSTYAIRRLVWVKLRRPMSCLQGDRRQAAGRMSDQ